MFNTKAKIPPPTQVHLNVRTFVSDPLVGDLLVADDGTLAGVLEIEPVDLTMADPDEAAFVRSQFGQFISSIRFPDALQFVMATYPQNLKVYLDRMRDLADARLKEAETLRDANADSARRLREERLGRRLERWLSFIQYTLAEVRPIENRYYVVVFHHPFVSLGRGQKPILTADVFEKARSILGRKLAHVQGGLDHAGFKWRRLTADEIAEVIYFFYHPVCSPLADMTAPKLRLLPSLVATGQGWTPNHAAGAQAASAEQGAAA
jgi:hypothetical protein